MLSPPSVSVSATVLRFVHLRRARGPGAQAAVVGYRAMRGERGLLARGARCRDNQSRGCLQMLRGWFVQRPRDDVYQGLYHLRNEWCRGLCWTGQCRRCGFCPIVQCPVAGEKHGPRPRVCVMPGSLSTTLHHHNSNIVYNRRNKTGWQSYNIHNPQWIIWGHHLYDWLFILIVIKPDVLELRRNMMNSFIMLKGFIM